MWLRERGYIEKVVRQKILKARKRKKKDLLNVIKDKTDDYKLVFNITYYPNFSNLKDTMSFLQLLLALDQEHQKYFIKLHYWFPKSEKSERYSCKSESSPSSKK